MGKLCYKVFAGSGVEYCQFSVYCFAKQLSQRHLYRKRVTMYNTDIAGVKVWQITRVMKYLDAMTPCFLKSRECDIESRVNTCLRDELFRFGSRFCEELLRVPSRFPVNICN